MGRAEGSGLTTEAAVQVNGPSVPLKIPTRSRRSRARRWIAALSEWRVMRPEQPAKML
jgi:hypothetical protein